MKVRTKDLTAELSLLPFPRRAETIFDVPAYHGLGMAKVKVGLAIAMLVACRGARAPLCGADSHPPDPTVPGWPLFASSDRACPNEEPSAGGACALPRVPQAWDAEGHPVEAFIPCHYAAPSRGPCEYDECTCKRKEPSAAPTWVCHEVIE
jgi:hypothetical protein